MKNKPTCRNSSKLQ